MAAMTQDEADDLLLQSAEDGNLDNLNRAIEAHRALDPDLEETLNSVIDKNRYTAIHLAVINNHPEILTALLDAGADPNTPDDYETTPLFMAAEVKSLPMVQTLIAKGADVNHKSSREETATHIAAKYGACDILQLLLEQGADPNVVSKSKTTPFGFAVMYKHTECVRILLDAGVDANQLVGRKPVIMRVFYKRDIVEGQPDEEPQPEILTLLLDRGADLNYTDDLGRTPLSASFENGWENHARLLLQRGANPNVSYLADDLGTRIGLRKINPELTDKLIDVLCEKGFEDGQCDILKQTKEMPTTAPAAGTRRSTRIKRTKKRFHSKK